MSMPLFSHRLRVYWEDTDAGGVVFYANYLKFFERARTEWLRTMGVAQSQLAQDESAMFVVTDTQVSYRAPARLDDELDVSVDLRKVGGVSIQIHQEARREGLLLAQGDIRIGCVHTGSLAPRRMPQRLAALLAPWVPSLKPPTPAGWVNP